MGRNRHNNGHGRIAQHGPINSVAMMAGLLSLLLLLIFPLQRIHHFGTRLRTPQTVSQIERHIFVAQPKVVHAQVANYAAMLTPFAAIVSTSQIKPLPGFDLADRVPLPRLLLRLKLGSSRASSPDPLV
jgi:hypothetical protein